MNKAYSLLLGFLFLIVGLLAMFSAHMYSELESVKSSTSREISGNTLIENINARLNRNEAVTIEESTDPEFPASADSYSFADCTDCEEKVGSMIDDAIEALPSPTPLVVTTTSTTKTQTSYIPLGSTASSTSTDWYSVGNASAYIDLVNDFNSSAYVTFEASLKIKHGNGEAHVRLWDDTNKIAVEGSELVTIANEDYKYKKSGRLYLWNGNNNYMVQIKSVGGYEATVSDAKVKVVY